MIEGGGDGGLGVGSYHTCFGRIDKIRGHERRTVYRGGQTGAGEQSTGSSEGQRSKLKPEGQARSKLTPEGEARSKLMPEGQARSKLTPEGQARSLYAAESQQKSRPCHPGIEAAPTVYVLILEAF